MKVVRFSKSPKGGRKKQRKNGLKKWSHERQRRGQRDGRWAACARFVFNVRLRGAKSPATGSRLSARGIRVQSRAENRSFLLTRKFSRNLREAEAVGWKR